MRKIKEIEKSVDKKAGKRISPRERRIINFFVKSLNPIQYILFIISFSLIIFCSYVIECKMNHLAENQRYGIMSIALALFGAMVSVLAVLLSKDTEKYIGKSLLKFITFHSYLIDNIYFILSPCIVALFYLFGCVIYNYQIITASFSVIFSSIIAIILFVRLIVIDKTKLLFANYFPLHKRLLIDNLIPNEIPFDHFFIKKEDGTLSIGTDEDLEFIRKNNKYISKYNDLFNKYVDYFLDCNELTENDISSLELLIGQFRIKKYDYDSIVYFRYFTDQLFAIFFCYLKEKSFSRVYRLIVAYLNLVESILLSAEIDKLFVKFTTFDYTEEELTRSKRIREQTQAQMLFAFSFSGIKELEGIIILFKSTSSIKVGSYKDLLSKRLKSLTERIDVYQDTALFNGKGILTTEKKYKK